MPIDTARRTPTREMDIHDGDDPLKAVPSDSPSSYIDQLTPPAGTSFYFKQEFSFPIMNSEAAGTWLVSVHVYATGADPRQPGFSDKGGEIFVVLVHSGSTPSIAYEFQKLQFAIVLDELQPRLQLPQTGSGEPVYDGHGDWTGYTRYTTHFQRTMAMFRNNGNESFSFDAGFERVLEQYRTTQTGAFTSDQQGVEFIMESTGRGVSQIWDIGGLSLFRTVTAVSEIAMTLTYKYEIHTSQGKESGARMQKYTITLPYMAA